MMKIKSLQNGTPVLFLEQGIESQDRVAVRGLMEQLVREKAAELSRKGRKTLAFTEALGTPRVGDETVEGIGAYTDTEYVESVFGLRSSNNVRHRGRPL